MATRMLLMLAIIAFGTASAQAKDSDQPKLKLHPVEQKLLDKTNEVRARYGRAPLKMEPTLIKSAREHTKWMCRARSLSHTSKAVGENIAWGQGDVDEALESWMNSSGHRANILSSEYTRIGVAAFYIEGDRIYWCQQFLR